MSNLCRVNLEVCESVESRVRRGKMLQRVPVALLVMVCRCKFGFRRRPKYFTSETQGTDALSI
jgi:hypothetical protein